MTHKESCLFTYKIVKKKTLGYFYPYHSQSLTLLLIAPPLIRFEMH